MRQDLAYVWRSLMRRPIVAAAAVCTLALGIGAGTAVFSLVDRILWRPLPFAEPDRLVHVSNGPVTFFGNRLVSQSFLDLAVVQSAGVWAAGGLNLDGDADSARLSAAVVDPGFFVTLGVEPYLGTTLPSTDAPEKFAVLNYDTWRTLFGADHAIVGQVVSLNSQPYFVTGVMPPGFVFPGRTDVWVPPRSDSQLTGAAFAVDLVARLAPGVTLPQAQAAMSSYQVDRYVAAGQSPDIPPDRRIRVTPLASHLTRDAQATSILLAASASLLLFVVCASIANLLLARVAASGHELAVRYALGASRWRIIRLYLFEAACLSIAGAGLGFFVALWTANGLRTIVPDVLGDPGLASLDFRVMGLAVAIATLTLIVVGAVPGFAATSVRAGQVVRGGRDGGQSPFWRRCRGVLITGQVAIALVLLTASAAAVSAFRIAMAIDLGFGNRQTVAATVTLPQSRYPEPPDVVAFFERAHERLSNAPGIRRVAATEWLPGSSELGVGISVRVPDRTPLGALPFFVSYWRASPDYFSVMGIRMIAGRPFAARDRAGAPPVVVLSESAASGLFPDERWPIGRDVEFDGLGNEGTVHEVVGIVADVRRNLDADERSLRQAYVSLLHSPPFGNISLVVEADGDPAAVPTAMAAAMGEVSPALPLYDVHLLDAVAAQYLAAHRLAGLLVGGFALVTLLVAAIGLYGLVAQVVTTRMREFAIRLALGASPRRLRAGLMWRAVALAVAGIGIGAVAATTGFHLLQSVVPVLADVSFSMLAFNATVLLATAVLAAWWPASRVNHIEPQRVLNDE